MLVLSRRPDESIVIGNDIEIMVVGIDGNQVQLGITAPKETLILRKELKFKKDDGDPIDER